MCDVILAMLGVGATKQRCNLKFCNLQNGLEVYLIALRVGAEASGFYSLFAEL